jgi:hypothetical protein
MASVVPPLIAPVIPSNSGEESVIIDCTKSNFFEVGHWDEVWWFRVVPAAYSLNMFFFSKAMISSNELGRPRSLPLMKK